MTRPNTRRLFATASLLNKPHVIPTLKITSKIFTLYDIPKLLKERISVAPSFYNRVPVILDLEGASTQNTAVKGSDMADLFAAIRTLNVYPIGICNAPADIQAAALEANIPMMVSTQKMAQTYAATPTPSVTVTQSRSTASPTAEKLVARKAEQSQAQPSTPPPAPAPQQAPPAPTFFETVIIDKSIRSGQVVYARDANLVICGSLNSGAEVMADGDIIVFGQLDGRALAGASGHSKAKIVTNSFRAELVSIGNVFRVGEDVTLDRDLPAAIWLENGQLQYCSFAKPIIKSSPFHSSSPTPS